MIKCRIYHQIRSVMPADYSRLREIEKASFPNPSKWDLRPVEPEDLRRFCNRGAIGEQPTYRMLVAANRAGNVCGMLIYHFFFAGISQPSHRIVIDKVAVSPEYRRRGVATDLIDRVIAKTCENGYRDIFVAVGRQYLPMAELAKRCGFRYEAAGSACLTYRWRLRNEAPHLEATPGEAIDWRM